MRMFSSLKACLAALLLTAAIATPALADEASTTTTTGGSSALTARDIPTPAFALADEKKPESKFTLKGAFRFRLHYELTEGGKDATGGGANFGRNRLRVRYRLLLDFGFKDDCFEAGVRLGSGVGSATSAYSTFGTDLVGGGQQNFAPDAIWVRYVWARVTLFEMLKVTLGMFAPPSTMFTSILTVDSDIAFTGLHLGVAALEQKDDKKKVTMALYINALALYLEDAGTDADEGEDNWAFAATVDFRVSIIQVGLGFWHITHTFASTTHSSQFQDRLFAALEFYVKAAFEFGLSVYAHLVLNANGGRSNAVAQRGKGFGMLGGVTYAMGNKGEAGYMVIDLIYYYMEENAWVNNWTDADTGRNTGMPGSAGIEFNFKYFICVNVAVGWEMNFSYFIRDVVAGDDHDLYAVMLFDIEFIFG